MSLDASLKSASSLVRHRNVLTRAERLDKLKESEKWDDSKSPFGLPKVGHRKAAEAKAVKEEAAEGATVAAPAAGAKAPAGKAAAPAAAAKGAAPAAKGAAPAAKGAAPAAKGAPAAKAAAPAAKKK